MSPRLTLFAIAAASLALAPLAVHAEAAPADAPVATAAGHAPAPISTDEATAIQIQETIAEDADNDPAAKPDRKPHGFVTAGVGTGGYREVGGAVTLPVGQDGQVTVAIDDAHLDGRRR